jgi:uncharacterized protein
MPIDAVIAEVRDAMTLLSSGGPDDFKRLQADIPGFPDGVDAWIGRHWIITAIDSGSLAAVNWMIAERVNLNFKDAEGYTVLHAAMERGGAHHIGMLEALIAAGADVNAHGLNDWTPLHMAAYRSQREVVELLLAAGADRNIRTRIDHYATAADETKSPDMAELIRNFRKP